MFNSSIQGCPDDHAVVKPSLVSEPIIAQEIEIEWTGTVHCSRGAGAAKRFGEGEILYRVQGEKEYRNAKAIKTQANNEIVVFKTTVPPIEAKAGDTISVAFSMGGRTRPSTMATNLG
jgi:hypothetical protein